jgi:hypothetical protein
MNELLYTLEIVSLGGGLGWFISRWLPTKRSKAKSLAQLERESNVLEVSMAPTAKRMRVLRYCGNLSRERCSCPKCLMIWCWREGVEICHCDLLKYSHFHLDCNGTVNRGKPDQRDNVGCKSKFLMLAADVPKDYDPYEIVVPEEPKKEETK